MPLFVLIITSSGCAQNKQFQLFGVPTIQNCNAVTTVTDFMYATSLSKRRRMNFKQFCRYKLSVLQRKSSSLNFHLSRIFPVYLLYKLGGKLTATAKEDCLIFFCVYVGRLYVLFCVIISCRDNKNEIVNLWDGLHERACTCHQIWRLCGNFHFFVSFWATTI